MDENNNMFPEQEIPQPPQNLDYYADTTDTTEVNEASPQTAPVYHPYPAYSQYQQQTQPYAQQQWPMQPLPLPEKKRKLSGAAIALIAVAVLVVGALGAMGTLRLLGNAGSRPLPPSPPPVTNDDTRMELGYTADADRSIAAVEGGLTPVEIHEKLRDTNVAVQIHGGQRDAVVSEGSGIIIHENAAGTHTYIVTCAHVIAGRQRVSIELYNGETFAAAIVGYDVRTDVGLLQIEATGLNGATFGDSSQLRVGEPVYAIGNPGGIRFMGSFTSGVVSAIDRSITATHTMVTIQHTAPISPGNSGGALVNAMGQVVGINSQKIAELQFEGMGFAVPSTTVQEVVNHLIAQGFVPNRPKLGIRFLLATETAPGSFVVRSNNLPSGSMIIARIDDDSDFVDSDVRVNDIITHVNGNPITRPEVLMRVIENGEVGQQLTLSMAWVGSDFAITTFDVRVRLVEDRSVFELEDEATRPWFEEQLDPFGNPFR